MGGGYKMKEKLKKVGAIAALPVVAVAFTGVGFALDNPQTVEVEKVVEQIVEVEKLVEVPVEVETIVEVEVDNGNLDLVLEHLYDNDGNVEYLIDDLDDDEVAEIVDRIVFIDYVKKVAVDTVKSDGIKEMHKEYVGEIRIDEDDVERFKIYTDDEDVLVEDVDFEDEDAEVLVKVRFELDDEEAKFGAVFKVEFKEGSVDDLELVELYERE